MPFRLAAVVSVLLFGIACGARRPVDDVVPFAELGRYAFMAPIPGGQRLAGTLDVAPDTLIARANSVDCRVASTQPSGDYLAYECTVPGTTGVDLFIDRRNPTRTSRWATTTRVVKKRDVCIDYRTWENGTRTCIRSEPQEYFERVRVEGSLVVTR
jgi:hypothetical protein